jgi:CheY-like chemotaxis protein
MEARRGQKAKYPLAPLFIFQSLKGRYPMNKSVVVEILLVEDDDSDAELTLRALKQNHLSNQVRRFTDGQEVLDYLFPPESYPVTGGNPTPKLILLDLKLPLVSGLEVLKKIKNDPHTKKIPVVVLTSSTEEQDIVESYNLGVNSYIVKPVEFDSFMESMHTLGLYWLLLNEYPTK